MLRTGQHQLCTSAHTPGRRLVRPRFRRHL